VDVEVELESSLELSVESELSPSGDGNVLEPSPVEDCVLEPRPVED
jgi:hypothetical protein